MADSLQAIVSGLVQGVFFRAWTRDQARLLGLRGWVRNLPDGTVAVLAQGPKKDLDRFEALLWEGPPDSRVREVAAKRVEWFEDYADFEIRR
ncbi:MAG: acylphosphatase [Desulfovibrionaceae bacterium]|nr:acylphosphatase [Desulfovibrionaceae bacterium]